MFYLLLNVYYWYYCCLCFWLIIYFYVVFDASFSSYNVLPTAGSLARRHHYETGGFLKFHYTVDSWEGGWIREWEMMEAVPEGRSRWSFKTSIEDGTTYQRASPVVNGCSHFGEGYESPKDPRIYSFLAGATS